MAAARVLGRSYAQLAEKLASIDIRECECNLNNKLSGGLQCNVLASMSKRDWTGDLTLTLIGATVLVFMVACATGIIISQYAKIHEVYAAYQKNAGNDRKQAADEAAQTCDRRSDLRLCIAETLETYYRDQTANQDLQAQQDMAFWAAALFISSTALTSAGLLLIWRTLIHTRVAATHAGEAVVEAKAATKAAQDAVAVTQAIGQAQVRAYIASVTSWISVRHNTNPKCVETSISLRNFGQSPARKVHIVYRSAITVDGGMTLRETGPVTSPDWGSAMGKDIASGTDHQFRMLHTNLNLTDDEVLAIQDPTRIFLFLTTLKIRFMDVFGVEHEEVQHWNGAVTKLSATEDFFRSEFHALTFKIWDEERTAKSHAQP